MKIKSDFITNSSSSSFIVAFDEFPKSADEMKKILFGSREEFQNPYGENEYWDTALIAQIVYGDTHEATDDELVQEFCEQYECDFEKYKKEDGHYDWEKYSADQLEYAKSEKMEFLERNFGRRICVYEYSDNDGSLQASMEHGNIFRRLEHIRISKH